MHAFPRSITHTCMHMHKMHTQYIRALLPSQAHAFAVHIEALGAPASPWKEDLVFAEEQLLEGNYERCRDVSLAIKVRMQKCVYGGKNGKGRYEELSPQRHRSGLGSSFMPCTGRMWLWDGASFLLGPLSSSLFATTVRFGPLRALQIMPWRMGISNFMI